MFEEVRCSYTIRHYSDLNPVLGINWHIRGINSRMNFCYVHMQTVQYNLHKRQTLVDFTPEGEEVLSSGYTLVFRFFRMDGVKEDWKSVSEQ